MFGYGFNNIDIKRPLGSKRNKSDLSPKPYLWKSKKVPKPINPLSKKMASSLEIYAQKKKQYVKKNPECEAHFCNCNVATEHLTIHHKMGRVGYANDEKRDLNIPLLIDEDYFLAVCLSAHRWIEDNLAKAKAWGFSLDRNQEQPV